MPPPLRLISWPYDNGRRDAGMGAGATRLAQDAGFRAALEAGGRSVSHVAIDPVDEAEPEVRRVFELLRRLSGEVQGTVAEGTLPLVVAGNCISALGTVAGAGADDVGVVWFDAHADFDDPEENLSGFLDVMALAMLTGRGWSALRSTITGHRAVPERDVVLSGVRDLEPYQRRRISESALRVVPDAVDPERFAAALAMLSSRVERIYVHVDLDVIDANEVRANPYAAPGGPSVERLVECLRLARERHPIAAAAITAWDPSLDEDDRALVAARRIAAELAR